MLDIDHGLRGFHDYLMVVVTMDVAAIRFEVMIVRVDDKVL